VGRLFQNAHDLIGVPVRQRLQEDAIDKAEMAVLAPGAKGERIACQVGQARQASSIAERLHDLSKPARLQSGCTWPIVKRLAPQGADRSGR
jgi:hypothetical protein